MTIDTLGDITRHHRRERPDDIAMVYTTDGRQWTFKELDDESCQVAQALMAAGINAGDRVAYLDKNTPEYFTLLYGITKLNAVSVAVNWRLSASEMEFILQNSESKVLLIGAEFLGHLEQMSLDIDEIVVIGDPGDSGYLSYEQWIANCPVEDPEVAATAEDTCYQLYTSGTTGLPKGVELTHG
ncbi:MAG: AMP-binding protein, partial [Pseudomonadales bacterium]|nr:AMP-binding protein [Pseudomonadales bacterium]